MRNLRIVMDQVLDIIPDDFEDKENISNQFDWMLKDRWYIPPELRIDQWREFVKILNIRLNPNLRNILEMPWICDILSLVNDKPINMIDTLETK